MDNKNIIDKGWQQMKITLDKNMPVVSPYKKPNYFLYALLLIPFLFIAISVYYFSSDYKSANPAQSPKIMYDSVNYQIADINNSPNNINSRFNNKIKVENAQQKIAKTSNTNSKFESKNGSKKQKKYKFGDSEKNNKFIANVNTDESRTKEILFNLNETDIYSNSFVENRKIKISNLLTNLNIIEIPSNNITIQNFNPKYFVHKTLRNKKKYHHFLALNLITENGKSFGGVEFAAMVKTKLFGKFSLSSGLDFDYLSKSGMENSFFKTFNIKDPLINFNTRNMKLEEYNANFNSPVLRSPFVKDLFYMGLPVVLNLDIADFEIGLGTKLSYMILGTNYYNDYNDLERYNYLLKSSDNYYKTGIYNKLDYGLIMGVGYSLTDKFIISWNFDYSMNWIISSPNFQSDKNSSGLLIYRYNEENRYDKNVYFSLGLKYKIN